MDGSEGVWSRNSLKEILLFSFATQCALIVLLVLNP